MSMAEKYPLTEKPFELKKPAYARWQYTLSGWIRMIRTDDTQEGQEMERQILSRMWEDKEFDRKIRKQCEDWTNEDPEDTWEKYQEKLELESRKPVRIQGKYKGRGHGEKRR
jgi:hypothetical protein